MKEGGGRPGALPRTLCAAAVCGLIVSSGAPALAEQALDQICPSVPTTRVFGRAGGELTGDSVVVQTSPQPDEGTEPRTFEPRGPSSVDTPSTHLYEFSLPPGWSGLAVLESAALDSFYSLATYTCDGEAMRATVSPASEQALFIQGSDTEEVTGVIEVTLENTRTTEPRSYKFQLLEAKGGTDNGSVPSRGDEFLGALKAADYDQLVTFGQCDSVRPERCEPSCDASCIAGANSAVHALLGFDPPADEAVVAFIGIAGTDRVVQLSPGVPGHFRTLGRPKDLWLLYIEDADSPYQNSIDVEFTSVARVGDFESFDPTGQRSVGRLTPTRVVRVGLRRVRVRRPPVEIEVTFTRSGATYGLRRWQRAYRVDAWSSVSFGAGFFLPFDDVTLQSADLVAPVLASGELPDYRGIVPVSHTRRVFVAGMVRWNGARERAADRVGLDRLAWTLVPEAVVGLGLPASGNKAFYVGGNWHFARNLGISVGLTLINQDRLLPQFAVGDRLTETDYPRDMFTADQITTGELVREISFGLTYDVLALRALLLN